MKKNLLKAFRILFTIALLFMVYKESGFFTSLFCTMIAAANEIIAQTGKKQNEVNKHIEHYIKTNSASTLEMMRKLENMKKDIDSLI